MANTVSFKINSLTSALSGEYVRITDTSRGLIYESNELTTDDSGNATVNIGENGSTGQDVLVYVDNFNNSDLSAFKGTMGAAKVIALAGSFTYTFDGATTATLDSSVTLTTPYSISFTASSSSASNGAVIGSTADSTDVLLRSDGRYRIANNTTTATFEGAFNDGLPHDVLIEVRDDSKAYLFVDGVQSGGSQSFTGDFTFDVIGSEGTANYFNGEISSINAGSVSWEIASSGTELQPSDPAGNTATISPYNESNWTFTEAPEARTMYLFMQQGQSLAAGVTASGNAIVNLDSLDDAYLFNGVPANSLASVAADSSDVTSLIPYIETTKQTNGYSALSTLIGDLDDGGSWLWANSALGGATIDDLTPPGSTPYDNFSLYAQSASAAAATYGKTLVIPFVNWVQGESNWQTGQESYITSLRALHDLYISEANTATGQTDLPMILELTGKSLAHDIACALYEYTARYDDAYCSLPKYFLNRLYYSEDSDRTHLNPNGYIIQGEYEGIAGAKLISAGDSKCLEPIAFTASGATIDVQLNVPTLPLVIDTTTLPAAPGYGFKYIKPDLTEIVPTVTISGDTVTLDIGIAPEVGGVVDCGNTLIDAVDYNGAQHSCTNIRESTGIASAVAGWELNHWLVEFKHTLTEVS